MRFIVSPHSFVDLITNSSSELFVCNTKKSVDAVKDVLKVLADLRNQRLPHIEDRYCGGPLPTDDKLFCGVFAEPVAMEWSFNLYDFPNSGLWFSMYEDYYAKYYSYLRTEGFVSHPVQIECQKNMDAWNKKNPSPAYPDDDVLKGKELKAAMKKYHAHQIAQADMAKKLFKKWHDMELAIRKELYTWAAKENGIDLKPLGRLMIMRNTWSNVYFSKMNDEVRETKAAKFIASIDDAIGWGYNFKKGDVFLRSDSDNSIPSDFWPDIEGAFHNVTRRHCG